MKKLLFTLGIILWAVSLSAQVAVGSGFAQRGGAGGGVTGLTFDGSGLVFGSPADSVIFEIPVSFEATVTIISTVESIFVVFGNKQAQDLARFINDRDGAVGDSSIVFTKLGGATFSGALTAGTITSDDGVTATTLVRGATIQSFGGQNTDALIILSADEGDDNPDDWSIISEATGNDLSFVNHTTEVMNLTSAGDLQVDGDINIANNKKLRLNDNAYIQFFDIGIDNISWYSGTSFFYQNQGRNADDIFTFTRFSTHQMTDSDGRQAFTKWAPFVNQTATAALDVLYVDATLNGLGDGSTGDGNNLLNLSVSSVPKFLVSTDGDMTLSAGDAQIYDIADLAAESFDDETDFSQATWTLGGEVAADGTNAKYEFASTGAGTILQTSGNMVISGVANRWYVFDYTVASSTVAGETVTISGSTFASTIITLDVSSNGAKTVTFFSATVPGNFTITVAGATSGAFTITDVSLKMVNGGDLTVSGDITTFGDANIDGTVNLLTGGNIVMGTEGSSEGGSITIFRTAAGNSLLINKAGIQRAGTQGIAIKTIGAGDIMFSLTNDETVRFHASGGVSIGDDVVATDPGADNLLLEGVLELQSAPIFASYTRHHDLGIGSAILGPNAPTPITIGTSRGLGFDADNEAAYVEAEIPSEWDGASNFSFNIHWQGENGDPVADTEKVKWDIHYRSVAIGEAVDQGTLVTATTTFTGGASEGDKETYQTVITIVFATGTQPLTAGDQIYIQIDRDVTGEAGGGGGYSGEAIITMVELEYTAIALGTH